MAGSAMTKLACSEVDVGFPPDFSTKLSAEIASITALADSIATDHPDLVFDHTLTEDAPQDSNMALTLQKIKSGQAAVFFFSNSVAAVVDFDPKNPDDLFVSYRYGDRARESLSAARDSGAPALNLHAPLAFPHYDPANSGIEDRMTLKLRNVVAKALSELSVEAPHNLSEESLPKGEDFRFQFPPPTEIEI